MGGRPRTWRYDFDPKSIPAHIDYCVKRSSNGSTLSDIVHSRVLSRVERSHSLKLFCKGLESDISDIQGGTTHEGIHLGAMAGTVDIRQRCYTGLQFHDDIFILNPRIPADLPELRMRIKYRGRWLGIAVSSESPTVTCDQCELETTKISFRGTIHLLAPGETLTLDLQERVSNGPTG
jgi:alpha,alpha-trehalase